MSILSSYNFKILHHYQDFIWRKKSKKTLVQKEKEGKKEGKGIEKPLVIEQMLSQKQIWHALKMV